MRPWPLANKRLSEGASINILFPTGIDKVGDEEGGTGPAKSGNSWCPCSGITRAQVEPSWGSSGNLQGFEGAGTPEEAGISQVHAKEE